MQDEPLGSKVNNPFTNFDENEVKAFLETGEVNLTHSGFHRTHLHKSADQSIPVGVWTDLNFDLEQIDVGDIHDTVINNERVTFKKAGCYAIKFQIEWDGKENRQFSGRIYKNGTTDIQAFTQVAGKDGVLGTHIFDN